MDLREYLLVLRRRRWTIFFLTSIVVISALLLSFLQTPVYRATARLQLDRDQSLFGSGQRSFDPSFVETQTQVIQSQPVRDAVRERFGSAPRVSVTQVGTTSIVAVSAESHRANFAADIANAYVEAYAEHQGKQAAEAAAAQVTELQAQIDGLQRRIDALGSQLAGIPPCTSTNPPSVCAQREGLQQDRDALIAQQVPFKQKLDQVQIDTKVGNSGVQIVTPASVPGNPVRPTPVRNGLLALGMGLLFGVSVALLLEYLDDSISDKEDLERSTPGVPVLGVIPLVGSWKDRDQPRVTAISEPSSPSAEAYRTLRTSIRFLGVDHPLRTLQITSPSPGEGKTTTTANLAVALARAGERVVMVSCDLRRPRLHSFFGLSNQVGFTSVLLGEAPLSGALQPVTDDGRLWLLSAGPLPPNPSELLSSARAGEVLTGLEAYADTVLIDCPPVLPVTDAAVLSAKADATLLVVSARLSTRKQVARAVELLERVSAPLVGTVLNNAPAERADGYVYRYYGPSQHVGRSLPNRAKVTSEGNGSSPSDGKRPTEQAAMSED
jgi:capsular exopolysaccharide synthesis family protein